MSNRALRAVKPEEAVLHAPRRLDIACGQNKTPGFKGIDMAGDADITHDLMEFPWPIKTSSVSEVVCHHFVEHIPHYLPQFNGQDGWWLFFAELHRIMRKDATARFVHPYSRSDRAWWDPTHTRAIHEMTWYYLDRTWRQANRIDHYGTDVDFEVVTINGTGVPDEIANRAEAQQAYARSYYFNVVADLEVILKVRK